MSHVMSNLEIREFNINDIEELYEVELTSFTDPWSKESFKEEDCCQRFNPASLKVVITMAVATSIDALAVGVSFAFLGIKSCSSILYPAGIIGFVSFFMSLIGLIFGIRFGCGIARKLRAELWGGIILILIGTKILIEHLFFNN